MNKQSPFIQPAAISDNEVLLLAHELCSLMEDDEALDELESTIEQYAPPRYQEECEHLHSTQTQEQDEILALLDQIEMILHAPRR